MDDEGLSLDVGKTSLVPFDIRFPMNMTNQDGTAAAELKVNDTGGNERIVILKLLGPRQ